MPKKRKISRRKKLHGRKRTPNKTLRNRLFGLMFLCLTFIILFLPQIWSFSKIDKNNPIKISSSLLKSTETQSNPTKILIPKVDIDLKVNSARIINGYWELSENTASYGLGSGQPGNKGNIVIFAHARKGLFYNLKNIKIGDVVYIFTKDNWFSYKVDKIIEVYPNQKEIIMPTENEVLTLYTCTGFYDEKRLIVKALREINK